MSISILLADDSITIQKVIGIIFGGEDYSLTIVDNGKAAVDKAAEINPDVLLIDALMPGMSGYEVCEHVRATPALAQKPILLLTGSFEPFDEDKAKSCGADAFLSKPFESQQIVSKVKELFELGASRSAVAPVEEIPEVDFGVTPPPLTPEPEQAAEMTPAESAPVPSDIWGAFTPVVEQPVQAAAEEATIVAEPNVFAVIDEEPEVSLEPPASFDSAPSEQIGSKWIPADEHTFEFEEETIAELPDSVLTEPVQGVQETAFGEVSFAEPEAESKTTEVSFDQASSLVPEETVSAFNEASMPGILESIPAFEESSRADFVRSAALSVPHPGPPAEAAMPVSEPEVSSFVPPVPAEGKEPAAAEAGASAPVAMSEEQLRAAITSVSREVIERIVWEVVPDLAEALIKDAIRRIKEGQ